MADLERVRRWADALIALHLDPTVWSFGFDNAKKRAGLCNYTAKHISVSRYLAARYDDDEIHQILLHEVAHELAPWVGQCPAGHEHFRYREPQRPLSCGLCRRGFDRANLIVWRHREITPAIRRRAASAAAG
jgi:hypothetical protein